MTDYILITNGIGTQITIYILKLLYFNKPKIYFDKLFNVTYEPGTILSTLTLNEYLFT